MTEFELSQDRHVFSGAGRKAFFAGIQFSANPYAVESANSPQARSWNFGYKSAADAAGYRLVAGIYVKPEPAKFTKKPFKKFVPRDSRAQR